TQKTFLFSNSLLKGRTLFTAFLLVNIKFSFVLSIEKRIVLVVIKFFSTTKKPAFSSLTLLFSESFLVERIVNIIYEFRVLLDLDNSTLCFCCFHKLLKYHLLQLLFLA